VSVTIRKATIADAAAISAIAESVRYRPETADPTRGYLVFVGTPAEYAARLALSDTNYVAESQGKIVAYLTTSFASGNTATHVTDATVAEMLFGGGALLVDQIGVRPDARGLGAAPLLYAHAMEELRPPRATACIMHQPLRNLRSIGFFEGRMGWRCIGEYGEGDGFVWGVYETQSAAPQSSEA
jgi:ribosomal protein S18 acetylase RimI-like enzyme